MQKLLYAVLMVTQKLLHYFTDHKVMVVTSYPLEDVIRNYDAVGRISKWTLKLMGHDIRYVPHTAIKSQALVDLSSNGRRSSYQSQTSPMNTGQCTSTGP